MRLEVFLLQHVPSLRIPVSILIEKGTDFHDFIMDLRANRSLSSLIVTLLKAYHEDRDIKTIFDVSLTSDDSLTEIKAQLERVRLEHNKNIMTTSMLGSRVSESLEDISKPLNNKYTEGSQSTQNMQLLPSGVDSSILDRLSSLESILPKIDQKLNSILSSLSSPTTPKSETNLSVPSDTNEVKSRSNSQDSDFLSIIAALDSSNVEDFESTSTSNTSTQSKVDNEVGTTPTAKKPSSFGKALKSINK